MTKKEHQALQQEFNRIQEYRNKSDEAFGRLQELNATEGTGTKWCSAEHNYKDLLSVGKDYTWLYDSYVEYRGMESALLSVGCVLARLNFWKHA